MKKKSVKKEDKNNDKYGIEVEKVKTILKDTVSYNELMKFVVPSNGSTIQLYSSIFVPSIYSITI